MNNEIIHKEFVTIHSEERSILALSVLLIHSFIYWTVRNWDIFGCISNCKTTTTNVICVLYLQRSNGAALICLHEQNERNGDRYHYYVLYGLLAWTNDSTNIDDTVSPHLFTNIFNYRYWLEKRLKSYI